VQQEGVAPEGVGVVVASVEEVPGGAVELAGDVVLVVGHQLGAGPVEARQVAG
jgi:hypothetical protein